jgi:16S rRNA (guanine527-N7)-methyltransferase
MDTARIAELLQPFLVPLSPGAEAALLSETQLNNISMYIDMLLRWNARMNLTAVRDEENIVTRHFGESLFAARHLFSSAHKNHVGTAAPACPEPSRRGCPVEQSSTTQDASGVHLIDIGSGAGFPGLPIKLWAPHIHLTLTESNHKKATFLREVVRKLSLTQADVFANRIQEFGQQGEIVTLRAVERFEEALPVSAKLVAPNGRIALLIGEQQAERATDLIPHFKWDKPQRVPQSSNRILLLGTNLQT